MISKMTFLKNIAVHSEGIIAISLKNQNTLNLWFHSERHQILIYSASLVYSFWNWKNTFNIHLENHWITDCQAVRVIPRVWGSESTTYFNVYFIIFHIHGALGMDLTSRMSLYFFAVLRTLGFVFQLEFPPKKTLLWFWDTSPTPPNITRKRKSRSKSQGPSTSKRPVEKAWLWHMHPWNLR